MALAAAMLTPACGNNAGKETKAEVQESAAVQANVTHLTKADFLAKVYNYEKNPKEWKYEGDKPAIVDFYATWCGPCKAIASVLEKRLRNIKGRLWSIRLIRIRNLSCRQLLVYAASRPFCSFRQRELLRWRKEPCLKKL